MAYDDFKSNILGIALAAFRKRATLARNIYTDLSGAANTGEPGESLRIVRVNKPADSKITNAAINNAQPTVDTAVTHKFQLTLNIWKRMYWDVSDKDAYDTGNRMYVPVAATYGARLADELERLMFLEMARGSGFNNGTAGTTPFASNVDALVEARKELFERDAYENSGMFLFVDPDASENLQKRTEFYSAAIRGPQGETTGTEGALGRRSGFTILESNNLPSITRKQDKVYEANGAISVGDTSFGINGVTGGSTGTGFNGGEIITNGGNSYAIRQGFNGASGTVEVDRPVVAAIADDADFTRLNTHQCNFAMHPNALAFAMRPTAPPFTGSARQPIGSLTDPETGFSLTLEETRIVHGWRYYVSFLAGVRVAQPEMIQRILG